MFRADIIRTQRRVSTYRSSDPHIFYFSFVGVSCQYRIDLRRLVDFLRFGGSCIVFLCRYHIQLLYRFSDSYRSDISFISIVSISYRTVSIIGFLSMYNSCVGILSLPFRSSVSNIGFLSVQYFVLSVSHRYRIAARLSFDINH